MESDSASDDVDDDNGCLVDARTYMKSFALITTTGYVLHLNTYCDGDYPNEIYRWDRDIFSGDGNKIMRRYLCYCCREKRQLQK